MIEFSLLASRESKSSPLQVIGIRLPSFDRLPLFLGPCDCHLARRPRLVQPGPERPRVQQLHRIEELSLHAVLAVVPQLAQEAIVSPRELKQLVAWSGIRGGGGVAFGL